MAIHTKQLSSLVSMLQRYIADNDGNRYEPSVLTGFINDAQLRVALDLQLLQRRVTPTWTDEAQTLTLTETNAPGFCGIVLLGHFNHNNEGYTELIWKKEADTLDLFGTERDTEGIPRYAWLTFNNGTWVVNVYPVPADTTSAHKIRLVYPAAPDNLVEDADTMQMPIVAQSCVETYAKMLLAEDAQFAKEIDRLDYKYMNDISRAKDFLKTPVLSQNECITFQDYYG